jgi:putative acetyltransferase
MLNDAAKGTHEVVVRPQEAGDAAAVFKVNAAAFPSDAEAKLVSRLQQSGIPLVSLVAEDESGIIGHILFSPVTLDVAPELKIMGLAPMAVIPQRQNQGIGSMLVRAGLQRCRELGAGAVVVLGHPAYYPRFGFVSASALGIRSEYDVPDDVFMITELIPGFLEGREGAVAYDRSFAELD